LFQAEGNWFYLVDSESYVSAVSFLGGECDRTGCLRLLADPNSANAHPVSVKAFDHLLKIGIESLGPRKRFFRAIDRFYAEEDNLFFKISVGSVFALNADSSCSDLYDYVAREKGQDRALLKLSCKGQEINSDATKIRFVFPVNGVTSLDLRVVGPLKPLTASSAPVKSLASKSAFPKMQPPSSPIFNAGVANLKQAYGEHSMATRYNSTLAMSRGGENAANGGFGKSWSNPPPAPVVAPAAPPPPPPPPLAAPPAPAGTIGLVNLGNTCYINAGAQCLAHLPEMREFAAVNSEHSSSFVRAWCTLVKSLWTPGVRPIVPSEFKVFLFDFFCDF
jgi:hypothetical protein